MSAAEAVVRDNLVERRAWKDGFNAGERAGYMRVFQTPALEQIASELVMLRTLYGAVCDALAGAEHQVHVLEQELDYRAPGWDA